MENIERFAPLYAIAYAIMNSTENLRFDKEDYFHVLVFYTGYFIYKRNRKHFPPCLITYSYRNTRGSLGELLRARVPTSISRSPICKHGINVVCCVGRVEIQIEI